MMDSLKKLKDKKGESKMHPMEQKAKMDVLGDLREMAEKAMGGKLKDMNKVTVAADSKEGLQDGLDKARDVLGHLPEALDVSHPDHENFLHSENKEDGKDGMSAYPDADGDHLLEADPDAEHEQDEHEEHDMQHLAHGGMAEEEEASPYDDMDDDELEQHLHHLMKSKKKKGLAR